ncbi:hypothetical protein GCM10027596_28750 [Nocardioides korecus]
MTGDDARLETVAPRRPRHLLDPADLHAHHVRSQGSRESLTRVQTWVMSVLAVTTILHLALGAAAVGYFAPVGRLDARVGANVMAGVIGVLAVAVGFMIHRRSPVTVWLVVGLLPGLLGAWFTFR